MADRDILIQAFDAFRYEQEMTKVAGLEYYQGLTKEAAEEEFLTSKFIKVAQMQGKDPWELAYQIANSMGRLEKVANQMPLFRYYLEWADDMEKRAGIALLRGLGAAAKAGVKGLGRAVKPARFRSVAPSPGTGGMGKAFKASVKQTRQVQATGGGSYSRGKKLMKAETGGVDPTKLKGPQTTIGSPKAAPTGAPKPAPAGAPAPVQAGPTGQPQLATQPAASVPLPPAPSQAQQMGRQQLGQQASRTPAPQKQAPAPKKPSADVPVETAGSAAAPATTDAGAAAPDAPLVSPERKKQLLNAAIGAGVLSAPVAAYQTFKPTQGQQPRY